MSALEVYTLPKYATSIEPGRIPAGTQSVDANVSQIFELKPGAIPDSVTHLYLCKLTEFMHIPPTVTHLAVQDFKKDMIAYVPTTVTHLYVHVVDREEGPDRIHYLFSRNMPSSFHFVERAKYNIGKLTENTSFGILFIVGKLTPHQLATTEIVPEPTVPSEQSLETGITVGKTYTDLTIDDSVKNRIIVPAFTGQLRPGSIPKRIECLNLKDCDINKIEEGVITDSVTHLFLVRLNGRMVIPASVKHLAILDFTRDTLQYVPKTVTHLYIHLLDCKHAPVDRPHYLFRMQGFEGKESMFQSDAYMVSEPYSASPFAYTTTFVKREPKPTLDQAITEIMRLKAKIDRLKTVDGVMSLIKKL